MRENDLLPASASMRVAGACLLFAVTVASGISCSARRELRILPQETVLEGDGGDLDIQWAYDFAFVATTVNGVGPLRFLLDTGARVVVISPAAAADVGLDTAPLNPDSAGVDLQAAHSTAVRVRWAAAIRELRAGPLRLRHVDASIVDLELFSGAVGHAFDGILPATAFREVLLTIDYPGRSVTVRRGELPVPGEGPEGAHVVPLTPGPLPCVTLSPGDGSGDEPITMLLDTGSSGFLSVPSVPTLRFRSGPVETGCLVTLGARVPRLQGRIDGSWRWAGHPLEDPVVTLASADLGAAGAALFRHFRVTLDIAHQRVGFDRASAEPIRCPPVRGTGAEVIRQPSAWLIDHVVEGSPAARAGLAAGDRVETVAGIPVADISRAVFDALVATQPSVPLRVSGPSGSRDLDVPVATFVE